MTQTAHHYLGTEMEQCIKLCEECYHTCIETITYCLQQGGKHAEAAHIGLLLDCAAICHTSTDFMLRSSPLHGRICADACWRCAESCRRMGTMAA